MRRYVSAVIVLLCAVTNAFGRVPGAAAQNSTADVDAGMPRFLLASANRTAPKVVDAQSLPVLRRRISLALQNVRLADALQLIAAKGHIQLNYSRDVVPLEHRVRVTADDITVAAALTEVLLGLGVDVLVGTNQQVALMRHVKMVMFVSGGTIVGRITDAKSGEPVARAEVLVDGAHLRTTTDTTGWYRLMDLEVGSYTMTVRRFGYAKRSAALTVQDGRTDTVNVALEPVAARLGELVTTATGRQRRLDIANDVTTINADSVMQAAPIRSLTDLLDTRVPGLTVQRTSGAPGDPARLRLRGASSPLQSNDPIVIVDGIRVYAEQSAARSANLADRGDSTQTRHYAAPSPIDYIDPNTIETIEVLKGPSAATLYGQDAANGVIVVTTKKGRAGPTRWTANLEQGRTQIEGDYPNLTFRAGHDLYHGVAVNCPATNVSEGGIPCQGDSVLTFQLLNDPALTVLDHHGHRTSLALGASGGSQALTYAVTGSYADERGLIKLPTYEADRYQTLLGFAPPDWMRHPQNFKQWGATSRITARLGSKADVSLAATLSRSEQQKSSLQNQLGALMGTYLDPASGIYYRWPGAGFAGNIALPVTDFLDNYYERATDNATQFTNGANVSYRPRSWLTLTADAGLSVAQRADQVFFPRGPANFISSGGFIAQGDTTGYISDAHGATVVSTVDLRANALVPLGRGFQFRFAAGANYAGTSISDIVASTYDLAPGSSLQGAKFLPPERTEASDATFGWYLEPSIGNSKFNFTSGLRLDGGSSFGANVKGLSLPTFPKLGVSYLLSDESWFPFKDLFQSFRVRLAYGKASRQPGITDRLRLYAAPGEVPNDGQFATAIQLQTLGNTEVRPERSTEFEGGFDTDLLDNRVTVTITAYRKTTDDALLSVPVAPSVYGLGASIIQNIGVTRNTGLELSVGGQVIRSGPVTWSTQLLLSQRRDMVVRLGPGVEPFYTSDGSSSTFTGGVRIAAGYPLYGRWSIPVLGYADANGDGLLEPQEIQLGDTAVYVGSTIPNYTASLSTTLSLWHGIIDVHADFSHEDGLAQRNMVAQALSIFSRGQQDPAASLAEQAATANLALGGARLSDYNWVQTVSTTRFNSLAVRYNVPVTVARRLGAQSLSVALQGANLGLWTNYRGLDPNVNAFGTGNDVTDTGVLPQPRTWQFRVSASY